MSEVNFPSDSGSPAEVAAFAEESAKVEAARAELYDEAAGESQGELILGKYRSVDDLASAYQSLQAEYSRLKGGVPQQQEQPVDNQVDNAEPETDEEEESQPRVTTEQAQQIRERIMQQAGGEQQYQRIAGWASQNLPEERLTSFNTALNSGDQGAILNQLKGLQYDFMMSNGYEPKLSGGRAPSNDVKAYTSKYQIQQAMMDPRYEHDAGYRRDVERRIGASPEELFNS
jgi:hypothetical protein